MAKYNITIFRSDLTNVRPNVPIEPHLKIPLKAMSASTFYFALY